MKTILALLVVLLLAVACDSTVRADDSDSRTFTTVQSVADLITGDYRVQTAGKWNPVGIDRSNQAVAAGALKHPAAFHLKIEVFEPFHKNGWAYRIKFPDGKVVIQGYDVPYRVWAVFREDQADALSRIHKGAYVMVSGTIRRADLRMYDGKPWLSINLNEAVLGD